MTLRGVRGEHVEDLTKEMVELVGSSTDPNMLGTLAITEAFRAFGEGRLANAADAWRRTGELLTEYRPVSLARSTRAALWLGDAAAARADLAGVDASGLHGPAIEADRVTLRAGVAALDGRSADALALYRNALQAWRDLGLAWDEALCGVDMATLLDPADPEVRAAADAARDILVRLEAAPFVARLDAALARTPEPVRQPA